MPRDAAGLSPMNIEIPQAFISLPLLGQGMFNPRPQKGSAGMIELLELLQSRLEVLKGADRQGGEVRGAVHHLLTELITGTQSEHAGY